MLRRVSDCLTRCLVAAVISFLTFFSSAAGSPPNDHFTNSITITGTNITVAGTVAGATLESGEIAPYSGGMTGTMTVWYSWVAPANGRVYYRTPTFSQARWTSAYVGSNLSNLRRVPFIERVSNLSFLATEGTVYHFQLGGVPENGDSSFTAIWELLQEAPCDNDNFADAAILTGQAFNTWYTGGPMPPLHWITGASIEAGEPKHRLDGPDKSLWWKWVAPLNARLAPETRASTVTNVVITIYRGDSVESLTLLGRYTNSASPGLIVTAGDTYYIAASTPTNAAGDIFLGGFANTITEAGGYTAHVPVPGNVLQNPSFEQGVLFDLWFVSAGFGGYVNERGGADGDSWPSVSAGFKMWQDIPTVPGHQYRIRFLWRFGSTAGAGARSSRVLWNSNEVGIANISATYPNTWFCPTFIATASNTTTRFMIENLVGVSEFDGCSVVDITAAPAIATQPQPANTLSGGTASFIVGVTGSEPLSYQWFKDGTAVSNATSRHLLIEHAEAASAGAYFVEVRNAFGTVTSSIVTLSVESPTYPIIVWQPHSEEAPIGGYAVFSALAAGSAPLSYQWLLNDQLIANATNRHFTIDPVDSSDIGNYRVVVSNSAGTVLSLPASLTIGNTSEGGAQIYFSNRGIMSGNPFGPTNPAPVFDVDGFTPLKGSNYVAQLYAGATIAELRAVGPPTPFYSGFDAGIFAHKIVTLPTTPPGSNVMLQARAWHRGIAATYEEARALGGKYGKSGIYEVTTTTQGSLPVGLQGLESFALQAGQPYLSAGTIRFESREPGGIAVWSLQGQANTRYVIEKSVKDFVWTPFLVLTNVTGTVTFNDTASSGSATVFFRARILE